MVRFREESWRSRVGLSQRSDAPRQYATNALSRHRWACPSGAMLLASTRPTPFPATAGLVPAERCSSPARDPTPFPATAGLVPAERCSSPARDPTPFPATAGLVPAERCSSPARDPTPFPPPLGLSQRSDLLASTRPTPFPATAGLVPAERCSSPARDPTPFPATACRRGNFLQNGPQVGDRDHHHEGHEDPEGGIPRVLHESGWREDWMADPLQQYRTGRSSVSFTELFVLLISFVVVLCGGRR